MSESKTPNDPDINPKPPENPEPKTVPNTSKQVVESTKSIPVPVVPQVKSGKGLISFVGRLRRSSRKSRATAAAARQAAEEAQRKADREKRFAEADLKKNPTFPGKSGSGIYSRSSADELVKPITSKDLNDTPLKTDNAAESSAQPKRLSIEKVERTGTRSQRKAPPTPLDPKAEKAELRRKNIVGGFKIGLALLFFVVVGVLVFLSLRETRVKVAINTSPAYEIDPEVLIVTDFQERIDLLKRDLQRRQTPLRNEVSAIDQDLSAAKADYAGRAAKRKLLFDALNKDKSEIPTILEGTQKSLEKLWKEDADNLDAEYEAKKDAFNKDISGRAKQLNLTQYAPSDEMDAPEIAVNAFRLALYSAPDSVETGKEREWAEARLKSWRKFEEDWSDRQLKIKQEADALRQTVQPEIDEVKGRVVLRQEEIAAVDLEIDEFAKEVARHEGRIKESKEQLAAVSQPFYEDLLKAPNEYVLVRWKAEKLGLIDVRNLDRDPNFPPGEYRLLVRAKKKGVDYWAQKIFLVEKYKTTQVTLGDDDFLPVKALLEEK